MTDVVSGNRRLILTVLAIGLLFGGFMWIAAAQSENRWDNKMAQLRDDVVVSDDIRALTDQMAGYRPSPSRPERPAESGVGMPHYLGAGLMMLIGAICAIAAIVLPGGSPTNPNRASKT